MDKYFNKNIFNIKYSGLAQFFEIANKTKDCISLSVGEPDFDTPYHVSIEGIKAIKDGNTFYSTSRGLNKLLEEIIAFYKRRYNLVYNLDEVMTTIGASEAIDLICRIMLDEGDEVIVPNPGYVAYEPCIVLNKAKMVPLFLDYQDEFKIHLDKLEALITPKTKMIILNSPNNPTGRVLSKEELEIISKIAITNDLIVVSDEIYSELIYEKQHISIASIPNMKERTIVINGFSKTYSMTGWRLGYMLGPKAFIDKMLLVHQYSVMCAPIISQYAGIEALTNGDEDIINMKKEYQRRRNYVVSRLNKMGLPCHLPDGAFYCFVNIKKFGLSSYDFCLNLIKEEKVVVIPGDSFGQSGEGFIRISYAYSLADLTKALDKIEHYIKKIELRK